MGPQVVPIPGPSDTCRVFRLTCTLTLALLTLPLSAVAAGPVVAVFDLKVSGGVKFDAQALEQLSEYISTELSASGRYEVVPRAELKRALTAEKRESYRACYDESCQIEVGKELAAEKTVAGTIGKFGKSCIVTLKLIDLAKATAEAGASARGKCTPDDVLTSLESALGELTGRKKQPKLPNVATLVAPLKALHPAAMGAADPLVKLEIYGDYECPHTRALWKQLSPLFEVYAKDMQVRFLHHPLKQHVGADLAAKAALAGEAQGRFWSMHKCLLRTQTSMSATVLRCARGARLDVRKWKYAVRSPAVSDRLAEDRDLASDRAPGTPTSYVNGYQMRGALSQEAFVKVIEAELKKARDLVRGGASRARAVSSASKDNRKNTIHASLRLAGPESRGPKKDKTSRRKRRKRRR